MASIKKRGSSYLIKVSCGYNCKGKQMVQTMTWKPEPGMSVRQIEHRVRTLHSKNESIRSPR